MSQGTLGAGRRYRRRQETISEIVDVAVRLMAENGVAGLSLGEVARQLGVRTPSLYGYFPSKNALYDAVFARGARGVLAVVSEERGRSNASTAEEALLLSGRAMAGWCLANPVYAQLLFWRPVPDFTPSPEAYAPAVALVDKSREWFTELRDRGLIRPDVDVEAVLRDWIVIVSGVISQQLSNAPDEDLDTGRFTSALPSLTAMFARQYGANQPDQREKPHADQR